MTGEDDPERAALALLKAGAQLVVITLGGERRDPARRAASSTSPACRPTW